KEITHVMVYNATKIADQMAAQFIVVATQGGLTACGLSKQRGSVPILGISDSQSTLQQMCLFWGVTPLPGITGTESVHLLKAIEDWATQLGRLTSGQRVVLVGSTNWSIRGHNVLIIHEVS
ncbi:MAG TPA: pyruvate kinase alpha/beta domain-containing protein, partial [Pirellulales bacterium]